MTTAVSTKVLTDTGACVTTVAIEACSTALSPYEPDAIEDTPRESVSSRVALMHPPSSATQRARSTGDNAHTIITGDDAPAIINLEMAMRMAHVNAVAAGKRSALNDAARLGDRDCVMTRPRAEGEDEHDGDDVGASAAEDVHAVGASGTAGNDDDSLLGERGPHGDNPVFDVTQLAKMGIPRAGYKEVIDDFLEEVMQQLEISHAAIRSLAAGEAVDAHALWNTARRGVHTVKGSASYVGFDRLQAYALDWLATFGSIQTLPTDRHDGLRALGQELDALVLRTQAFGKAAHERIGRESLAPFECESDPADLTDDD